ncbi:hypothetical protein Bca52824_052817 [Brassica carinata]|uniref:Uncharacterized protein n=1 Tax=Brassica carinata TaxID=52824 RepID=A0A8X7UK11_BRACI|nr:hypothetical protein Bca52824_052817 [Brassica carinata]
MCLRRRHASQPLYLCLSLSPTSLEASREIKLRNIIALEQCHYPKQNHVCSYALFLDYLIDTDKDVDLLLEKVAQMVNKLVTVILDPGSYYYDIAGEVNKSSSVCISVSRGQGQPPSALRFYWR